MIKGMFFKMRSRILIPIILLVIISGFGSIIYIKKNWANNLGKEITAYSGSESCKPCHEKFYQLWHDSYHGLAMQPVTGSFIRENIHAFNKTIRVGTDTFEVAMEGDSLFFIEKQASGAISRYPAVHTMGGKYIYYFLTPISGGRLQVLPLAYDCDTDSWYNNPESGVRHFENIEDAPLDWMSHLYTFNTTCYNCHVSQLETNYNLEENTYNTTWREPGINCETCHGPSYDHIVACVEAGEGNVPDDLKIVRTGTFTPEQHNSACGSCHAKAGVIAQSFEPGAMFYDYFDLVTLENPDFYADGRDLGENYTMTSWEMNKCAAESDMHCVTCHTSSGRYRFSGENANDACMPCHSDKVNNVSSHTFHKPDSEGSKCISCHMPKTTFARMDRSDHSFRPPMPRASMTFGSPNACNICHDDKSAEWSQEEIEKTHAREYQEETIKNGLLIRKARAGDWSEVSRILNGLSDNSFDKVFTTSFIRLLENYEGRDKWDVILELTKDESPLVRGAAAHSLYMSSSVEIFRRLTEMLDDDYRLVRLNAAFAISSYPGSYIDESNNHKIAAALQEYEKSLITNPDDWSAHYNLGNYYSNLNDFEKALDAYRTSMKVYSEAIMPMVNAGFINSLRGNYTVAEELFTRALSFDPSNEAALLNLALLCGETGKKELAKEYLNRLLVVSSKNAVAAYNLAILESESNLKRAVELSRDAMEWESGNPKYAYTHAFFLNSTEKKDQAVLILRSVINEFPSYIESYILLSDILMNTGEYDEAREILKEALEINTLSNEQQRALTENLQQLEKYAN
jgi:tetratricopeptide (TPR) repeat protein